MEPAVNFKKGRMYHITRAQLGDFWLVGRYIGVTRYGRSPYPACYYAFEPMAINGEMNPKLEDKTGNYEFEFWQFPYTHHNKEIKLRDLPLYMSAENIYPLFEEILKNG